VLSDAGTRARLEEGGTYVQPLHRPSLPVTAEIARFAPIVASGARAE
jgi:hypothetical protein